MSINTLDRDTLLRQMAQMKERIKRLENTLQGQEVSGVKIKDLNWDKGAGGTLRLGGENDTDGSIKVYDAFNEEKVSIDKEGIEIYDGNFTMYDKNGNIIIDDEGIVSSTNFLNAVTSYGTTTTINSTSYVDLTNSSRTITTTRDTMCIFSLVFPASLNESVGNTGNTVTFIDIDGVKVNSAAVFIFSGNNSRQTYGITYFKILGAGTHTAKVSSRFETMTGSPTMTISEYTFSHILLGT